MEVNGVMIKRHGTREEVAFGQAFSTKGGLRKDDLLFKFISKRASDRAKTTGRFRKDPKAGPSKREIQQQHREQKKKEQAEKRAAKLEAKRSASN